MRTYKEFVNEEVMPFAQTDKSFVGVESEAVRDNINDLLDGVTSKGFVTPYNALERVSKVLAYSHIHLPKYTFSEGDHGATAFQVHQFGIKAGMTNQGEFVKEVPPEYYVYFEYHKNETGLYDVFACLCDKDELDELIDDYENEADNDFDDKFVDKLDKNSHDYETNAEEHMGYLEERMRTDPPNPARQVIPEIASMAMKKVKKRAVAMKEEQLNELGDTEKGRERLEKYAAKAHSQTGYKSKLTPKEKKRLEYSDKALAIVDKKSGKKTIRSSSPLYDYDEEVKLDEVNLKTKINAYGERAAGPAGGYNYGDEDWDKADRIRNLIVKKHGEEMGKHADSHADSIAFGRSTRGRRKVPANLTGHKIDKDTLSGGTNPYGILSTDKRTKTGTIPKNTQKGMANVLRKRKISGPKGNLPEETQLDEVTEKRKELLKRYIKQAPHSVAALSAATRGFARDADAQRKDKKAMDARKSDERADKMFKKSWKRRQYIAKAVDKLTSEEKSVMPAWYEKEKSKSASLRAMTDAKKKEQKKKTDSAIRRLKEENGKTWMKVASKVGLLPKDKEDDSKIQIIDKKGFIKALKDGKKKKS